MFTTTRININEAGAFPRCRESHDIPGRRLIPQLRERQHHGSVFLLSRARPGTDHGGDREHARAGYAAQGVRDARIPARIAPGDQGRKVQRWPPIARA